jgi:hypothetical protein
VGWFSHFSETIDFEKHKGKIVRRISINQTLVNKTEKTPFSSNQLFLYDFILFFWLDPKEPKSQDAAKLLPHKAGRWPAAASSHAPIIPKFCA